MFGISFHTPLLLATGLVALLPVLLHFASRGAARTAPFSSLIFLRRAVQRKARQIRIENRRLMLLRSLAALLLALALAQPVFKWGGTATVHPGSEVTAVLVIDNSMSMSVVENTRTRLERAKEAALTILDGFSENDRVALLLASAQPAILLGEPTVRHDECRDAIARIAFAWTASDLFGSFQEALTILRNAETPVREIYLITDLQKNAWSRFGELPADARTPGVSVYLCDVGLEETPNTAITQARVQPPSVLPGAPVEIAFEIVHYGPAARGNVGLQCQFDGGRALQNVLSLSPGRPVLQQYMQRYNTPGVRPGQARLDRDALMADNTRYFAVDVASTREVLLLDGPGETGAGATPGRFLASALRTLMANPSGGFELHVEMDTDLRRLEAPGAEDFDLIVLAHPPRLTPEQVFRLRNLAEAGAGVLLFLGANADIETLNRHASPGLIPGTLRGLVDAPGHLQSVDFSYPALTLFRNLRNGDLSLPVIHQYHRIDADAEARVLARFGGGAPALLSRRIGRGEVAVAAFSADDSMTDFPARKIYLPLWAEFTRHLTSRSQIATMFLTGETVPVTGRVQAARAGSAQVLVERPDGTTTALSLRGEGRYVGAYFTDTQRPGVYRLRRPPEGAPEFFQPQAFAVNVPAAESDLTRADKGEIREALEGFPVRTFDSRNNLAPRLHAARSGSPLWNGILLAALALILFETWVSHRAWR